MKDFLQDPINWLLCTVGTFVLFFPFTFFSISDKTPVDGLLTIGFPFIFLTKGFFPPLEEFLLLAFTLNILVFFVISAISVFSIRILWNTLHSVKYQ